MEQFIPSPHDCEGCGYHAEVIGQPGFVSDVATDTFVCTGCREVFDAVIFHGAKGGGVEIPRCPRCGSATTLELWVSGDPCPRCRTPMLAK